MTSDNRTTKKIEELRRMSLAFPPNIRRKVNIALSEIEQAIADELNAELGSGTCEMEQLIRDMHRECTVCGYSCCTDNGECGIIQRIRKLGTEVDA